MPNIGPLELAIVLIIALVIFGPKKLPELGSSLGNGLREFKSSISGDSDSDKDRDETGAENAPADEPRRIESTATTTQQGESRPTAVRSADA